MVVTRGNIAQNVKIVRKKPITCQNYPPRSTDEEKKKTRHRNDKKKRGSPITPELYSDWWRARRHNKQNERAASVHGQQKGPKRW
ncbi:hypothetical protein GWI33_018910, partial [Rhynchophorus ferrugineus]